MKLRKPLIITAIALTSLFAGGASSASADPPVTGTTTTTFALTAGVLNLTVAGGAALTNAATGTTAISGNLGNVTVNDLRGGAAAWIASASSTQFTGGNGSGSTSVIYTAGVVTPTGTITVGPGVATANITSTLLAVVSPSAVSGNNSASWTPTLDVTMLPGARADNYSGIVTTSVV